MIETEPVIPGARPSFHVHARAVMKAKPRPRPVNRNGEVVTIKVDKRVWNAARRLAQGDTKRLVVISEREVLVQNNPK